MRLQFPIGNWKRSSAPPKSVYYDATLVGSPSVSSTAASYSSTQSAANFGNALSLNGSSQYAEVALGAVSFGASASWTIRGRFRSTNAIGIQVIVGSGKKAGGAGPSGGWWIAVINGVLTAYLKGLNGDAGFGTATVSDSNWHNFELNVNAGTSATIYVDGTAAGTGSGTYAGDGNNDIGSIGVLWSAGSAVFFFEGQVDEIAAFTTAQHSANYTPATTPISNAAANLRALWRFCGNAVDSAGFIYDRVDTVDAGGGWPILILVPNANAAVPYNAAVPTNYVMYVHGSGEVSTALLTDSLKATSVAAFLNAGYILCGSTAASATNWGNQASCNAYSDLDDYIRANYNANKVLIWAQSMGGMDGLLIIAQNIIANVAGFLGTYPATNLAAMYAGTGGFDFSSEVNIAYGITGTTPNTYAEKTANHDPCLMSAGSFGTLPMRFYASAGDTVVGKSQNTDTFKAIIAATASESVVVVCTGNHGDPSHFVPSEYTAFAARAFL